MPQNPGTNRGPSDLQSNALPTELSRLLLILDQDFFTYSRGVEGERILTNVAEGLKAG